MSLTWSIVVVALGICLVALAVYFRLGAHYLSRGWADRFGSTPSNVLLMLPGAGLAAIALGSVRWAHDGILMAVAFGTLCLGALLMLWGGFFDVPLWAVPRWARDRVATRRRQTRGR